MALPIKARIALSRERFHLEVNLALPGNGISALFGPSGSGKTTLLRCLAGLERATQAYIEVAGEVWQDTAQGVFLPPHRRALGYVFQEASLFPHLSVRGNLDYGMRRVALAQRRITPVAVCAMLGIEALLDRAPQHLSGGERQRVGIARALLTSPRLLLMDEPLAALDSALKQEILPYLERLRDELDIPLVYVSHAQDEVARLADHLAVLDHGELVASGPIGETLARLDLPLAHSQDAGVVVRAQVQHFDAHYQLLSLVLPDGLTPLRIAQPQRPHGSWLRVKILARDVSLSHQHESQSSILNRLPAQVRELVPADNPAHVLVSLACAGTVLLARITRYSADHLGLAPGQQVWAQIKAVALLA
ncbi:molybdenum ABC transporter ATP-binding protein [Pseudomonas typographi]|uniref:Molybdenum ABC transporter ATP-binding protein n=1 Tax=Pseudomonas typographi TaxID=2715964 RepID=A0ABR7Z835_9PSED|nr:molybdenum ABC transporter ATP-binding protein [Pseudomonas typographi]MBD1590060.1 molybdenum ABC transporter ATP-binding protein [Pseudomonas typographi]MBD1601700.1 molybdenum ABC transporter ATP-binding protein [Pseudomonas typographi]